MAHFDVSPSMKDVSLVSPSMVGGLRRAIMSMLEIDGDDRRRFRIWVPLFVQVSNHMQVQGVP